MPDDDDLAHRPSRLPLGIALESVSNDIPKIFGGNTTNLGQILTSPCVLGSIPS